MSHAQHYSVVFLGLRIEGGAAMERVYDDDDQMGGNRTNQGKYV